MVDTCLTLRLPHIPNFLFLVESNSEFLILDLSGTFIKEKINWDSFYFNHMDVTVINRSIDRYFSKPIKSLKILFRNLSARLMKYLKL